MNEFRVRLMEMLKRHLESDACRYTDNSVQYFLHLSEEAVRNDEAWLAAARIPTLQEFTRLHKDKISLQVDLKTPLYGLLRDEYSKETLLAVTAYGLLGHRLFKFPFYRPDTIEKRLRLHTAALRENPDSAMSQQIAGGYFHLTHPIYFYDASCCGIDATMYSIPHFLYTIAHDNDYRYDEGGVVIDVEPGDYVMDGGGCLGDTALFFAHKAGPEGRIFSFEPNPYQYIIFAYNLGLNPALRDRIVLADTAMSDTPGEECRFLFGGSGSRLDTTDAPAAETDFAVKTTSIDEEVRTRRLQRLDYIKMDIEGAELPALRGAVDSIKRFRPKLAICVYHKMEDPLVIPAFINSLGLGYRFYLKHHFVNSWETVLYARVE